MKKGIIKDIMLIVVGMMIVGVPVLAVSYIPSRDVSYATVYNENVTNVEEALDILTNQVNEINTTGTSVSSDILSGKTAYVNGKLLTGSMANYSGLSKAANNITKSGSNAEITIPGGYYDETSKITVPIDTINNNINDYELSGKKLPLSLIQNSSSQYWTTLPCEGYKKVTFEYKDKDRVIKICDENLTVIGSITQSTTSVTLDISQYSYLRLNTSTGTPTVYFTFQ